VERSSAVGVAASRLARTRAGRALRRPHNWIQLLKFSVVGATGYVVNLSVYSALVLGAGLDHRLAAICSFVVAVTNNYTWNRLWTFRGARGGVALQGMRFFTVAVLALIANLIVLEILIAFGLGKIVAQAFAIALVTPINFVGNKLWTFRHKS
jgi:putative flippase GtrA